MAIPFVASQSLFIVDSTQIASSGIFLTKPSADPGNQALYSSSINITSSAFEIFTSRSALYYNVGGANYTYTTVNSNGTGADGGLGLFCNPASINTGIPSAITATDFTPDAGYGYTTSTEYAPNNPDFSPYVWYTWRGLNPISGEAFPTDFTAIKRGDNFPPDGVNNIKIKLNFSTNPAVTQYLYNGTLKISIVSRQSTVDKPLRTLDWKRLYNPGSSTNNCIQNSTTLSNITWIPGVTNTYSIEWDTPQPYISDDPGADNQFSVALQLSFDTELPPPLVITYPELHLVYINPDGIFTSLQRINSTNFTSGSNNFSQNILLSQSFLPVENYKLGIAAKFFDSTTKFDNINITDFNFITNPAITQSNTPDPVNVGAAFEENFTNNDWNALFGNAFIPRYSQYFMDVDYSTSPEVGSSLTPINFNQLIAGTATRAPIQDYYYNLRRHIIPRYLGSKSTSPSFNTFSTDINDKGFGKDIVAGNPKPFVGYYGTKGGSRPEVIGKTIINLDYIIDEDIQTQVPALSDFTYDNQIQLFERGTYLYLDPDKKSTGQQFAGNRKYKIYRSGEYATPILYSQTGSTPGFLNQLTFTTDTENPIPDYYNALFYSRAGTSGSNDLKYLFWRWFGDGGGTLLWNSWVPIYQQGGSANLSPMYYPAASPPYYVSQSLLQIAYPEIYSFGTSTREFTYPLPAPTVEGIIYKNKVRVRLKVRNQTGNQVGAYILPPLNNLKLTLAIYGRTTTSTLTNADITNPNIIVSQSKIIPSDFLPGGTSTVTFDFETPPFLPFSEYKRIGFIAKVEDLDGNIVPLPNTGNMISYLFEVINGSYENIQIPNPTILDINYGTLSNGYITNITDATTPVSSIFFDPIFLQAYGKIYPQVSGSGYDSTIYPFEISPELPDVTTQPEYEIRFGADENLVFPIISSFIDVNSNNFVLIVSRPDNYSLQNNIVNPIRQSFLIRRWVPRAGYIYLDVAADLGSGIVKPEYITDGIKDKIPQIVKELTDKGLIQ